MKNDQPATDLGALYPLAMDAAREIVNEYVLYEPPERQILIGRIARIIERHSRGDAQATRLAAVEAERDDALVVVRNAQDYLRGKYTLEPLRTLRDAVRDWEAKHTH